jgi:uncharacterized integral membrane protein
VEFTITNVAGKLITVLVILFVLVSAGGVAFYTFSSDLGAAFAVPFVAGALVGLGVNIYKVHSLKATAHAIAAAPDAHSAALIQKSRHLVRLFVTVGVLLAVALFFHDLRDADSYRYSIVVGQVQIPLFINLIGTAVGLLTWPVAMYSLHFFIKDALVDDIMAASAAPATNSPQDAINEINKIVAEQESSEASEQEGESS